MNIINPTISLCMIVKNEEEFLPRCLQSIKGYLDEIIIVDTGSTDKTVEIAKSFGAKVFNHPWEGSFSKARNYSLKYATCDWILILDADEELSREDAPRLREIVKDTNYTAISFVIKNKFKNSTQESYANMIRLFKNFNGTHYDGIVHNTIKWSGKCLESSLSIIHHGYNLSEEKMEEKFLRTATLLKEQIKADPHNPTPHRYLGISYMGKGMYDEAIAESKTALKLAEERDCFTEDLFASYYIISAAFFEKGTLKESEAYALKKVEMDDRSLDGYCILSFIYYNLKEYDKFLKNSEKYLTLWDSITKHPERANTSISYTIGHKWKIHLLRGFYYLSSNQDEKSNIEIDTAQKESTEIEECLKLLGNFYLENNCHDKAEETYKKLLVINEGRTDTMIKMGRIRFRKGDLDEAISFWKKAVALDPELFDIRLLICKLYITLGSFDEVISECEQLLLTLDIPGNITIECLSDLGNTFTIIGKKLLERQDLQAAETSYNICNDLKELESRV